MNKTVFVIEDEKTSRILITSILRKMGITKIISSINGENALANLKSQKPDLIISGWNMPVMNGLVPCAVSPLNWLGRTFNSHDPPYRGVRHGRILASPVH